MGKLNLAAPDTGAAPVAPVEPVVQVTETETVAAPGAATAADIVAAAEDADKREDGTGTGAPPPAIDPLEKTKDEVEAAKGAIRDIDPKIAEALAVKAAAEKTLKALESAKDKHLAVIETKGAQLSHAEQVKRVQAQTQARLAQQKEQTALAASALKAAGISVYPSKLDQSFAQRKRTPEGAAAHARYIQQQQTERTNARTGVA